MSLAESMLILTDKVLIVETAKYRSHRSSSLTVKTARVAHVYYRGGACR